MYNLFTKTISGKTVTLTVDDATDVGSVKAGLQSKTGIPAVEQRLLYAGKQLSDGHVLSDYGISNNATLHMTMSLPGGTGALMQLVAIGAQDKFLTAGASITFFQTAHRAHTLFAMEDIEQLFTGTLGWGKTAQCQLSRSGDLCYGLYLQVQLPALTRQMFLDANDHQTVTQVAWTNSVGHALINTVTLTIGSVQIDKHYGRWLNLWSELTEKEEHRMGLNEMLGREESDIGLVGNADTPRTLYVPLQFWFCRHLGAALPIVALSYHDTLIKMELADLNALVVYLTAAGERYRPTTPVAKIENNAVELTKLSLFAKTIYLEGDERTRFAKQDHTYVIEQLQYNGQEAISDFHTSHEKQIRLNINHPTKALYFTAQHAENYKEGPCNNDWFNYSSNAPGSRNPAYSKDLLDTAQLRLNSHDRFAPARQASYFRLMQPAAHHTRIPKKHIYLYSFAISPEQSQPSGSCNFSRIDNAQLILRSNDTSKLPDSNAVHGVASWATIPGKYDVWAVSLNQIEIKGGMCGIKYAN